MRQLIPLSASARLRALGAVVTALILGAELMAAEPLRRVPFPGPPFPRGGPLFGVPGVPNPIPVPNPNPFPFPGPNANRPPLQPYFIVPPLAGAPELGVTGPTDRCLIIAGQNETRFTVTASANIDPGIFAAPRVQGLPVAAAARRPAR